MIVKYYIFVFYFVSFMRNSFAFFRMVCRNRTRCWRRSLLARVQVGIRPKGVSRWLSRPIKGLNGGMAGRRNSEIRRGGAQESELF